MIKFFRHIRQQLLMENKTTKYLKYAIGEVVLVIIGILLALQINNWNENRITKAKTDNYLRALITEIERNILSIESRIEGVHSDIEESANTLKELNLPEAKYYSDSVIRRVIVTRPIYKSPLFKSTFNDVINSGVLESIEDVDLKNKILLIEPLIENCYETSKKAEDAWDNYQLPYMLKNNNVSNNWDSINNVKIFKTPFTKKKKAFVHNFDYANILTLRMRMMGNFERQLGYTKKEFIKISNAIQQYLKE